MSLKTLKGIKEIDGYKVLHMEDAEKYEVVVDPYIEIDHVNNSINFYLQDAPVGAVKEERALEAFVKHIKFELWMNLRPMKEVDIREYAIKCRDENSPEWVEYWDTHPPVSGVNGCQVDTLIHAAKLMLEGLNKQQHCIENDNAINKLEMAIYWLNERTKNRTERGVEGISIT